MTSHPGHQTIAIHTLPNISRSKVNQTMKFDQAIEYNKRNIFKKKNYAENEDRTSFFLKTNKPVYQLKASSLQLGFNIFR